MAEVGWQIHGCLVGDFSDLVQVGWWAAPGSGESSGVGTGLPPQECLPALWSLLQPSGLLFK